MDKITHKVRCEQWTNIIKECLASGMPKTTWCREHGISDKSFFYWQRILREEAYLTTLENTLTPAVKENSAPTTTDFIEIKMTDQVSSADSPFKPDVVIRKGSVSAYGHFPRPSGPRSPARQGHIKRPVLRLAEPSFLRPANQCC